VQDVLQVCGAITPEENEKAKALLDRIVAMLTKLGQRGYAVCEEPGEYRTEEIDPDTDTDPDPERSKTGNRPPPAGGDGIPSLRRNVRQRTGNERRTHFTGLYVITDVLPWVQKAPCFFATPHGRRGY
jgi:hypothetical protein